MNDVPHRAAMPALLESQVGPSSLAGRFANIGERIVQAARLAVVEHLRQNGQQPPQLCDQMPSVIGGVDHADGDVHPELFDENDREAA